MKILVDEMPQNSAQCLFSWKHIEYSKRMCRLGGFCKMTDGKCERLQTLNGYPIDLRDEYFVRGYERGFKDGSMNE
jgi:hypothetical protein